TITHSLPFRYSLTTLSHLSQQRSFSSSPSSSLGAYICTNSTFIAATFNLIIKIPSEIGSHIITDFATSSLTITPTPLLLFFPPEKNTLYLSPPSLSVSSAWNDPSPSQHVSATPIIPIPILFISHKTFASLPDTYKLLTFHVAILLQSPTNDVKTPASPTPFTSV